MVSVASDVIFMLWWVGVTFMTNLRIGISGAGSTAANNCSFFVNSFCYLQWLSHLRQLCVVFYKYFDTRLSLIYVFYIEFGTWAVFVAAIYCQSEPC